MGLAVGGPLPAFALIGTIVTLVVIGIYILTNISCIAFYRRERPTEFNPILHAVFPVLGVLAFIPAIIATLGISFLGIELQPLSYPISLAPIVVVVWVLLGVAILVGLATQAPDRLARTGEVFEEG